MNYCITCKFYQVTHPAGLCRRNPPQIVTRVYTSDIDERAGRYHAEVGSATGPEWPETKADDWCGEHASK